jgi:phosphate transport system substrate-binding protein
MKISAFAFLGVVSAFAQDFTTLPEYKPEQRVNGVIRTLGNYHMETLLRFWEEGFRRHHPDVRFEDKMLGTANAIAGLYLETADIALMGREIIPMESIAFRRVFRYNATEIAVATASFNVPLETFAFAIFVHKDNPVSRLTLAQVAGLFGCTGAEAGCVAHTWADVGLTGGWAKRPVHLYGYETNTGLGYFFEQRVLGGKHGWNCGLHEYANVNTPDGKVSANAGDLMMRDLAKDPNGIAFCGFGHKTGQVKALALATDDHGLYVPLTRANVANRTYPLTRTVYFYLNRTPGKALAPIIKEFLHYILSREGQEDVAEQDVYLPLTVDMVAAGRAKLD